MNEKVKKVFEILGVEPNERFKLKEDEKIFEDTFYFDENLLVYGRFGGVIYINLLNKVLNGYYKIIKLPKKKKLRDLTPEEWDKWQKKNCSNCSKCIFANVLCYGSFVKESWIHHKDVYSDKFLNREIEVE